MSKHNIPTIIVQTGKCMLVWNKHIISRCQNFTGQFKFKEH